MPLNENLSYISSPPEYCDNCGAKMQHDVYQLFLIKGTSKIQEFIKSPIYQYVCRYCGSTSYETKKYRGKLTNNFYSESGYRVRLYPPIIPQSIPPPNEDMSTECRSIYNEAAQVFELSPRASAALMRLCLQQFFKDQGEKGKNINEEIKELVKTGIPTFLQKYMDACRVIGNNAVHPIELNLNENKELAEALFPSMNIIVEKLVSEPRRAKELYNKLPDGAKDAIGKRDAAIIEAERRERSFPHQKDDQGHEIKVAPSSQPSEQ
ncbi:MAG: DUF4145 domain-containing protein [Akkermansiaceae bacterium]|nr:DUF4145 domain-containing protein [Akkermansiaceae bacterium]